MITFRARYRCAFVVLSLFVAVIPAEASATEADSQADSDDKPAATAYDRTYAEWSTRWWQWLLAIPHSAEHPNPLLSSGAVDCSVGQHGKVWFLAGSTGGEPVVRSCVIPKKRALVFPLVNAFFMNGPGEAFTVKEKREALDGLVGLACKQSASVDGVPISFTNIAVRTQSAPFLLEIGENNVFGVPAGTVDATSISDGVWVVLPPLNPGHHELHFHGAFCDAATGEPFFEVDVTYQLDVQW